MKQAEANQLSEQKEQKQVSVARRGYILGLLTFIWAVSFLDRNVLSIVLDPVKKEFGLSDTMLGAMVGFGFALVYLVLSIPVARYVDRKPRTPIIVAGLALWSVLTALGGLAQNAWQMLVFRMGVGVGEASSTSPSISLIGDYFPKDKRPIAMSIFNMAPTVGLYMGFMIGGLAAHYYGWRVAFFFAGIPGIIAAILLRFTVKEPIRGLSDGPRVDVKFYSMGETLRYFGTNKTFLLVMGGAIMAAYTNFSLITWNPSFFRRVHHLNMAQIGLYVGTVTALAGIIGAIVCGTVTTALGKRDDRWKTATPGIACVIAGPLLLLECLPDSVPLALLGVASGFFLCGASVGLQLAIVQTVVKVRMRAFAASLHFMASNLFGMALAPLIIGILNDAFSPRYGVQAVRYSMLTVVPASILAGLCLIYGARFIRGDIKTALEEGTEGKPTSSG